MGRLWFLTKLHIISVIKQYTSLAIYPKELKTNVHIERLNSSYAWMSYFLNAWLLDKEKGKEIGCGSLNPLEAISVVGDCSNGSLLVCAHP